MALKVWTLNTNSAGFTAISTQSSTSAWDNSVYLGGNVCLYTTVLARPPLAVLYGSTVLTKVYNNVDLSGTNNSWLWGNYDSLGHDVLYINVGESVETSGSEIVYISTMTEVVPSSSLRDRIIINTRISNNSGEDIYIRTAMYNSSDVYVGNILPDLLVKAGKLIDDNSKLALPIGYKYKFEASTSKVSIVVSGDEY